MVEWQSDSTMLPLPGTPRKRPANSTELREWLTLNANSVRRLLDVHGAILLRGFGVDSAQQFQDIAEVFCSEFSDYVGGNSPRSKVLSHVFTSTEYAKEAGISMHNEASYLKHMPDTILFYCAKPAQTGGQTPLADCRRIFDRIDPQLRSRFESKGILYVNNMHGGKGLGRSWMDVFRTKDRDEVETSLNRDGYQFEWKANSGLRTVMKAPAILRHPRTLEYVWINQAEQWHPSSLDKSVHKQLLSMMSEDDLPHNAFFGDGSPLSEEDLKTVRAAMKSEERIFAWEQGDVLVCDNHLVMHGRQPYSGDRRILVALG